MTLRRALLTLTLLGAFAVQAQPAPWPHTGLSSVVLDPAAEHQRIAQQRQAHEAAFRQAEQACFDRFNVNDCLRQARAERRAVMDDLRRQEVILNDLQRQNSARAALQRLETKQTPGVDVQAPRQTAQPQAAPQAPEAVTGRAPPGTSAAGDEGVKAADALAAQRQYESKLLEAQQHKTERLKASGAGQAGKVQSLPIPADAR